MRRPFRPAVLTGFTATLLFVVACGPASPSGQQAQTGPGGAAPPAAPKTLTMAVVTEPNAFSNLVGGIAARGGSGNVKPIAHEGLVVMDDRGSYRPQLAAEQLSVESDTWRLNGDGTMDTVWKLRPNVRWHDGHPFTSADMMLAFATLKDAELPSLPTSGGRPDLMTSASAPDPFTFVVHWTAPYVRANEASNLDPIADHIVGDLYRTDKTAFLNHPWFTTEFVGLGAYRLVRWERGSHIEFARFDDYYRGSPALDRVIVRFMGDSNAMIAAILAEAVDVVLPSGETGDIDAALEVKRRWEGTGNQVVLAVKGEVENFEIQHQPAIARPGNGLTLRPVRQALYHALDRGMLAQATTQGLSPPADSVFRPTDELRPELEAYIPKLPYDPARAQRLLAEAGWNRTADGGLLHVSGERFVVQIMANAGPGIEREVSIVADYWKAVGVESEFDLVPPTRQGNREYEANMTGVFLTSPGALNYLDARLHSRFTPSAATRWAGSNRGGYNNPSWDALVDRLAVTIDTRERLNVLRQMTQEFADLPMMPLFWEIIPVLALRDVKLTPPSDQTATWGMFEWDYRV